jgi:hypothetical protein
LKRGAPGAGRSGSGRPEATGAGRPAGRPRRGAPGAERSGGGRPAAAPEVLRRSVGAAAGRRLDGEDWSRRVEDLLDGEGWDRWRARREVAGGDAHSASAGGVWR